MSPWMAKKFGNAAERPESSELRKIRIGSFSRRAPTQRDFVSLRPLHLRQHVFILVLMARPPKDVTDAEVSILHVLWDRGKATVREIAELLYSGRSASQQATVQKLLERLEAKDCVVRSRET